MKGITIGWWMMGMGMLSLPALLRAQEPALSVATSAYQQEMPPPQVSAPTQSIPQVLSYEGFLADKSGNPITGTLQSTISIWSAETGGQRLWFEDQSLDVNQGYFTAELGRKTQLMTSLFDGSNRWIELLIEGETLAPRKQLLSVPNAFYAVNAGNFNNLGVDQFYQRAQADDHKKNKIDAAFVGGIAASQFLSKPQLDAGYVPRNALNSVTSDMIVDGSIQVTDLGFTLGRGTITAVNPAVGLSGGGLTGEVSLGLAAEYLNGQAYDQRFIRKGEPGAVVSGMVAEESITGLQIKNGSIQINDLGFTVGGISQLVATNGLSGGGTSGIVTLSLTSDYVSGIAYDSRFINVNEENSVTSLMIRDGDITGLDIKNYSVTAEDLAFSVGDITAVQTGSGITGGQMSGDVTLQLAPAFLDGSAYDQRFLRRGQATITSDMIVDGTLQLQDMGFAVGDITSVAAGVGLNNEGSALSGDVKLRLDNTYLTGEAYDQRFIRRMETGAVSSLLIKDGDVAATDIGNGAVRPQHMQVPFFLTGAQTVGPVLGITNESSAPTSHGLEAKGYYGIKGVGQVTGVYGEGGIYGVYAHATGSSNPAAYSLYVDGRARCSNGTWSDLAEFVLPTGQPAAGDVVIIDDQSEHRVKKCERAYDTRIAGIISTDPTIMVGGQTEGVPLALSGIVPCKVTDEGGPIKPGDLLTTSSQSAHAMKAVEIRTGTILGKAMEAHTSGQGVIKVLVSLM